MTLDDKLQNLPTVPGCYLHKNAKGEIIYVGKAKNLRSRVRQYFQTSRAMDAKTLELVARIVDVEFIVTDTEAEALILESNLIKRHKPRYNVMLKDDKAYPHLKLTINEEFPRIFKTRRVEKDGAAYFGPYLPASLADKTVSLVNREFQLRTCSDEVYDIYKRAGRPCMEYQIKRCMGPCQKDLCKPDQYREAVDDVKLLLEGVLGEKRGRRVQILDPQRGKKREMIDLVEKNAKLGFDQRFRVIKPDWSKVLAELQETLGLPSYPHRIESFDISNIQGAENVAGMVVCEDGEMKKSDYRKFIIKTVEGADDFASMREAVYRRYSRLLKEEKQLPDLIFIDGGKGQLSSAAAALHELGLADLSIAGIVKPRGRHEEISHLLLKGREDEPVFLEKTSPVMRLVRIIRDETHRFAVSFHRQRRATRDFTSELTSIPGVGEKLKERLLRNFGSLKRVSEATVAELRPFVGQKQAEMIVEHFNCPPNHST